MHRGCHSRLKKNFVKTLYFPICFKIGAREREPPFVPVDRLRNKFCNKTCHVLRFRPIPSRFIFRQRVDRSIPRAAAASPRLHRFSSSVLRIHSFSPPFPAALFSPA